MSRVLVVYYSQSGQTARAVEGLVSAIAEPTSVDVVNLRECVAGAVNYPLPWSFFRFVRAQPEAFFPQAERSSATDIDFQRYQVVVIAYPVWFMSPAMPVSSWLLSLPPGSLEGVKVVTLSTCRNMWYTAQAWVRATVEAHGGRVVSHLTLEDRSQSLATLVTTPWFFLTSRRSFGSVFLRKLFPQFGIRDSQYEQFVKWLRQAARNGVEQVPSRFTFAPGRVLSEVVGIRISRSLYLFWPLAQRWGSVAEKCYLLIVALITVPLIVLLMPPALLVGRLPPLRGPLMRLQKNVVSVS
jgi:flavodoxin